MSSNWGWLLKLGVKKGLKTFENIFLPINDSLQFIEAEMLLSAISI